MSEQSSESRPVLAYLRTLQDTRNHRLAKAANSSSNALRLWVRAVRTQLEKIYGKDSPYLEVFPLISAPPVSSNIPGLPTLMPQSSDIDAPVVFAQRMAQLNRIVEDLESLVTNSVAPIRGKHIFIGHGRSLLWRVLKDFISDRLRLPCDEFNRESVAGITTFERLETMLSEATFAFLVMTAEEEHMDSTVHGRPNVMHEIGLFQGRLGPRRAIVMLEEGCAEFSNITGMSQLRFPRGAIAASFEEVRRVLEREGIIEPS